MTLSALPTVSACASANFSFTYTDAANEGFNDPNLGTGRRNAFQSALGVWGGYLNSPLTISVSASFDSLGGSSNAATLGQAGAPTFSRDFSSSNPKYRTNTFYQAPLANTLAGSDLNGGTSEIVAQFNSDVDNSTVLGNQNFYYGTDGNAGSDIDFFTVVLHEAGHGLGFGSFIQSSNGSYNQGVPTAYDRFLERGDGTDLTAQTDAERVASITSNDVFWSGVEGIAGNGDTRPKLYTPSTFVGGSSISHLDEAAHTFELMSPQFSGVDHQPSAMELGMFSDMGWSVNAIPEPGVMSCAAMGVLTAFTPRRRREAAR